MYRKTVLSNAGNVEFNGVMELNISPTSLAAGYHPRTDLDSFVSFWRLMRFAYKPLKCLPLHVHNYR